jgi:hypothetical protein
VRAQNSERQALSWLSYLDLEQKQRCAPIITHAMLLGILAATHHLVTHAVFGVQCCGCRFITNTADWMRVAEQHIVDTKVCTARFVRLDRSACFHDANPGSFSGLCGSCTFRIADRLQPFLLPAPSL